MSSEINQMTNIHITSAPAEGNVALHSLDLAWGAREIGRLIGKTPRACFHMLEQHQIPGAKKIGRQWVVSRKVLRDHFEQGAN